MYEIAFQKKIVLKRIGIEWSFKQLENFWNFKYNNIILKKLPVPRVSLINVATALAAILASNIIVQYQTIYNSLKKIFLPGRFQTVFYKPRVILDVAHNPHAALHLSKQLSSLKNYDKVHAVVGMLKNKDIKNTLSKLLNNIDFWYCAPLNVNNSANINQLTMHIPNVYNAFRNITDAFNYAFKSSNNEDIIVVFGSFYSVAEAIKEIKKFSTNVLKI